MKRENVRAVNLSRRWLLQKGLHNSAAGGYAFQCGQVSAWTNRPDVFTFYVSRFTSQVGPAHFRRAECCDSELEQPPAKPFRFLPEEFADTVFGQIDFGAAYIQELTDFLD